MQNKKISTGYVVLTLILKFFILLLVPSFSYGQEFIELPKPTHSSVGLPCMKLKVEAEIQTDFDKDLFFARPWDISVGKEYFYLYDLKMQKIFVFNSKYNYVGQCLDHGQGPGEVNPGYPMNRMIYAGQDDKLYLYDAIGDKLIQFSATGIFLKDIVAKRRRGSMTPFRPINDKEGYFYAYSVNNGIIDKLDSKMNLVETYLDVNLNKNFVGFKPPYEKHYKKYPFPNSWMMADNTNTIYDFTSDGHLFVYLVRSSTVFLLKGKKVVRKFNILIDSVLPLYQKKLKKVYDSKKKNGTLGSSLFYMNMFGECFVDHDEPYFYLQFSENSETCFLFQFDLKGKLTKKIINPDHSAIFKTKRNGLFYGLSQSDKHPVIFKLEGFLR